MTESDENLPIDNDVDVADRLLQLIVGYANKNLRFPLTLFVGGNIISGYLIGRKEYFEQFTTHFTIGWDEENARQFKEMFGVFDDPSDEDNTPVETLQYIHMKDAKVFTPGQEPIPANGLLWRGRLAAVDGFTFGIFSAEKRR